MAIKVALYNDDGTRGGSNDSVVVQLQSLLNYEDKPKYDAVVLTAPEYRAMG